MEEITKIKVKVPKDLTADQRYDVAIEILQYIHDRTQKGHGINNKPWKNQAARKYSESYAKKKGVPVSGPVDLTLSREMLGKMQYFKSLSKAGELVLGFKKGTKAEKKAEGNILGKYGQKTPIRGKARPFLGILQRDVRTIVDEVTNADQSE